MSSPLFRGMRRRKTTKVVVHIGKAIPARGSTLERGWLVRARARGGAETVRKAVSYDEACKLAEEMARTNSYREIWVDDASVVRRTWSDLFPRQQRRRDDDRHHVLVEEPNDDT